MVVVFVTFQTALLDPSNERKPGGLKIPPQAPKKAQLKAYQENKRASNSDESTVSITVGEEKFSYTANGMTRSPAKIAVSGEYFNDEIQRYGYARMYLIVEGIGYYAVRPVGNRLDVYVEDYYYNPFYFEIFSPYPVTARDLGIRQYNESTILVTGPSRSVVYHKIKEDKNPTGESAEDDQ